MQKRDRELNFDNIMFMFALLLLLTPLLVLQYSSTTAAGVRYYFECRREREKANFEC